MLSILKSLMSSDKVQDRINLSRKAIFCDELLWRRPNGNQIVRWDAELLCFIKQFLSNIRNNHPGSNVDEDLESVESEATKSKKEDRLIFLNFASSSDCMVCSVDCIRRNSCFSWCDAYQKLS
ncbi:hypothetical protein HG530_009194 [Fusarium avenaceum]|nr:hypothetical protein HG530_009194 [Fusarium avenaceum]